MERPEASSVLFGVSSTSAGCATSVPHLYDITFEEDEAMARCLVVSHDADASWWLLGRDDVDDRAEWRVGCWTFPLQVFSNKVTIRVE
jgi:hypothetical protein